MRLIEALERSCELLEASEDSPWSHLSVDEIRERLQAAIVAMRAGEAYDAQELLILFAPTAPINDIAIDNGWGDEYIELASVIDLLRPPARSWSARLRRAIRALWDRKDDADGLGQSRHR